MQRAFKVFRSFIVVTFHTFRVVKALTTLLIALKDLAEICKTRRGTTK
jgi:hypothetical protein